MNTYLKKGPSRLDDDWLLAYIPLFDKYKQEEPPNYNSVAGIFFHTENISSVSESLFEKSNDDNDGECRSCLEKIAD